MVKNPNWYSPKDTIWKSWDSRETKAAYREEIAKGGLHLVREVVAKIPGSRTRSDTYPDEYPASVLEDLADLADDEFVLLKSHGIQVPPVRWHTPTYKGQTRLVARVNIVEGRPLGDFYGSPEYRDFENRVAAYNHDTSPGFRLSEFSLYTGRVAIEQCMIGHLRGAPQLQGRFVVDIEPIFAS